MGTALGAAMTGGPVIAEIMYSDFLAVCMDDIVNQAAKIRYMTGGQARVALVIRSPIGMTRGVAASRRRIRSRWKRGSRTCRACASPCHPRRPMPRGC